MEPLGWYRKWGDPLGNSSSYLGVLPERRPFPITGNWKRYKFTVGNILFLMLSDRNDMPYPVGRGHSKEHRWGGHPAGAVTRKTFEWWKKQVLNNQTHLLQLYFVSIF